MTFSKFCLATQYVQKTVILFHGVLLMERNLDNLHAMLYQVDGFYVELFFRDGTAGIYRLKTFADVAGLEAYLRHIDISEITGLL